MARFLDSIRSLLLRLIFPPLVLADIQIEATLQRISTVTLVRNVLEKYLWNRNRQLRARTAWRPSRTDRNERARAMTPEETAYADECMRIFREEDR